MGSPWPPLPAGIHLSLLRQVAVCLPSPQVQSEVAGSPVTMPFSWIKNREPEEWEKRVIMAETQRDDLHAPGGSVVRHRSQLRRLMGEAGHSPRTEGRDGRSQVAGPGESQGGDRQGRDGLVSGTGGAQEGTDESCRGCRVFPRGGNSLFEDSQEGRMQSGRQVCQECEEPVLGSALPGIRGRKRGIAFLLKVRRGKVGGGREGWGELNTASMAEGLPSWGLTDPPGFQGSLAQA